MEVALRDCPSLRVTESDGTEGESCCRCLNQAERVKDRLLIMLSCSVKAVALVHSISTPSKGSSRTIYLFL